MPIRFQADADLDGRILRGLRCRAPEVDMRTATESMLMDLEDLEVLRFAADHHRILVSQDRRTMPANFSHFVARSESPGVILLCAAVPIAIAIEELLLIWSASEAEEWINRLVWIPSDVPRVVLQHSTVGTTGFRTPHPFCLEFWWAPLLEITGLRLTDVYGEMDASLDFHGTAND